jgi:catechol 2,3-dioxygenase-like lactoylglutathione lyase family enzyme
MSVSVGVLDHFNIRTRKLADTVQFYEDVLGLEKGARPNFAFPGAWMYSEGKPVVHLVDISRTDEPQKPDSGVVQPGFCRHEAAVGVQRNGIRLATGSGRRSLADLRR